MPCAEEPQALRGNLLQGVVILLLSIAGTSGIGPSTTGPTVLSLVGLLAGVLPSQSSSSFPSWPQPHNLTIRPHSPALSLLQASLNLPLHHAIARAVTSVPLRVGPLYKLPHTVLASGASHM